MSASKKFKPADLYAGGYTPMDGTIEFYARINRIIKPDSVVLDLGAGRASWADEGRFEYVKELRMFRGRVGSVIAADVDPVVTENATVDKAVMIEDGKLPLEDQSVDIIISDWVLEHIDNPEEFSKEVDRLLKPGGHFCARTNHKFGYVPLAARIVPNKAHASTLQSIQPERKEKDVFPTRYRMNTIADVQRAFPDYENYSYIYATEPAYYFGKKGLFNFLSFAHKVMPNWFSGTLMIFLRKPEKDL